MTVLVPEPVPLEMPPGDPAALEDFVEDVAGTAYRLAVVGTCLTGQAASAPGWHGADASAAATQVAVVAALAEELSGGVRAAAHRLRTHHECLMRTRRRVAALRAQQDEDFAVARGRLAGLPAPAFALWSDTPVAVAVVEELEAAEVGRRREHDRLLEELADDAISVARVLSDACRAVGGTGRRGDTGRVVAHLAGELPGWGVAELHRRGVALARALAGGPVRPEEMEALAGGAVGYAGSNAFARGLFAGLGVDGVQGLLRALGYNTLGPSSDVARVLSAAFGAAVANGRAHDPVGEVLTATYVAADDRDGDQDLAAAGLAAVLLAGATSGTGGVRPETAARWARQLLVRERAQGMAAGAGAVPLDWDPRALDPVALAFEVLVSGGETGPAADLLADRAVWDTVLARFWGDGGEALSAVAALAGAEPGPAGAGAVRSGLEALGAGLSEKGDPENWTVRKEIAAAVAGSLGEGVATHVTVATEVLQVALEGRLDGDADDVLRGLGYLTLDREAAAAVQSALVDWVRGQLPTMQGSSPEFPLTAVAVPGAYYAVQEYGQRLAHAIQGFEAQAAAEAAETVWNWTFGLAAELVPGVWGPMAGLAEGYGAILFGADGTWDNGVDRGLIFEREAAANGAIAQLGPDERAAARELAAQARAGYDRAAEALGRPGPPTSPEPDIYAPWRDAAADLGSGRAAGIAKKAPTGLRVGPP
jgi:hypothetical protein